jgi:hypothetical protein
VSGTTDRLFPCGHGESQFGMRSTSSAITCRQSRLEVGLRSLPRGREQVREGLRLTSGGGRIRIRHPSSRSRVTKAEATEWARALAAPREGRRRPDGASTPTVPAETASTGAGSARGAPSTGRRLPPSERIRGRTLGRPFVLSVGEVAPPGHSPRAPRDRRRGGRGPHSGPGSPPSRGWCPRPQGQSWRTFRWFFVGGSAHKRGPQFGGHRIAAGQRAFSSSGRRDSNPRPPPWQGSWDRFRYLRRWTDPAANRVFSFSCNRDGSRRFPIGDGTPTGPLGAISAGPLTEPDFAIRQAEAHG